MELAGIWRSAQSRHGASGSGQFRTSSCSDALRCNLQFVPVDNALAELELFSSKVTIGKLSFVFMVSNLDVHGSGDDDWCALAFVRTRQ
jgi:hypothetical protein